MLRAVLVSLLLAGPALAADGGPAAPQGAAPTKEDVAALKVALKDESKQAKAIEGIAKAWLKAWQADSQPRMHKADAKLVEWRRGVLEDLREAGISTREATFDPDAPNQERLRDIVVALREQQARFDDETAGRALYKKKSELLTELVAEMAARVDRYERRYDKKKAALKASKKAK